MKVQTSERVNREMSDLKIGNGGNLKIARNLSNLRGPLNNPH